MAKKIDYASLFSLRKDGRYQGSYTDDRGRHYVYDRNPEKLYKRISAIKSGEALERYTFKQAADDWLRRHGEEVGYKTFESYVAPLRRLNVQFGKLPLSHLDAHDITAFLISLGNQDFSRRSVQLHWDIINMICNHAIVNKRLRYNPCAAVSLPRNLPGKQRSLPDDEVIKKIRASAEAPFALFALVCLYSGLRRGEALALRYEDIDRGKKLIHVRKSVEFIGNNPHLKKPKTEAGTRDVILLDILDELLPKGKGYIFVSSEGKLLTKTMYRKRWAAYCRAIGCEVTAHQLRHGYATILFEAGVSDKDAQELLGHKNITTTRNIYTHIRQSRKSETADRLNRYFAASGSEESDINFDIK